MPSSHLWAGDLRVDTTDETLSLSLRLEWDGNPLHGVVSGARVRLAVSDLDRLGADRHHLLAAHIRPNATALVPLLAVIAATAGADLTIDAPVCPVAVAGARRAVAVGEATRGWSGITLGATAGASAPPNRAGTGLVFSLGLDPLAHLVALRRQEPAPTHLIALDDRTLAAAGWTTPLRHGASDGALADGDEYRRWRAEAMAANGARLPLVRVSTNAHTFLTHHPSDPITRSAVLAACALALTGVVGSVVIPVSPVDGDGVTDTIGLWSSGSVGITQPEAIETLVEAADLVASDPWARSSLRVCASHGGGANCGACRPCQLALTHLWLARASVGRNAPFHHGANPAIVRALDPAPVADRNDLLTMVEALGRVADGIDQDRESTSTDDRLLAAALADAWTIYLARCTSQRAPALSA